MKRSIAIKTNEIDDDKEAYTGKDDITQANNFLANTAAVAQDHLGETEDLEASSSDKFQEFSYDAVAEYEEDIALDSNVNFNIKDFKDSLFASLLANKEGDEGLNDQYESNHKLTLTFDKVLSLVDELGDKVVEDISTQLELAKAYLEIGDEDAAEEILSTVNYLHRYKKIRGSYVPSFSQNRRIS